MTHMDTMFVSELIWAFLCCCVCLHVVQDKVLVKHKDQELKFVDSFYQMLIKSHN